MYNFDIPLDKRGNKDSNSNKGDWDWNVVDEFLVEVIELVKFAQIINDDDQRHFAVRKRVIKAVVGFRCIDGPDSVDF